MMNTPVNHIEIVDDQAVVGSHRVKVKMIVNMHIRGRADIAEVMEQYGITAAEIHAALAYYYDNQMAFDQEYEEGQALLKQYGISTEQHLAEIRARHHPDQK